MKPREATREYRIAQWSQMFRERKDEGKTIREFCESRGIGRDSYYYWQRKVREAACEQLAIQQPYTKENVVSGFARVQVAGRPALPVEAESEQIIIEYGDVRISVGGRYAPEKLVVFVRELARP